MASRKCPACGARFDGKRCPSCYYIPFDAEEVSQPQGRELRGSMPPVRQAPARRRPRRRSSASRTLIAVCVSVLFLSAFLGILFAATRSVISSLSYSMAEPEPLEIPEDGLVLYDSGGIRVILDWSGGEITGNIPVFLENNSGRDVNACTAGASVNGCMNDHVFFYVEARKNTVGMSQLWIDTEELQNLGIDAIGEIALRLEILDSDSYEVLNDREIFSFGPGGGNSDMDSSGDVLFDSDGIFLAYQGMEADNYGNIYFRFYGANRTGKLLDLSASELMVNGQESGQYLWQSFFPDTEAVILVELYRASYLDITDPGDVETLEFTLSAVMDESWESEIVSDPILIRPGSN